MKENENKEQSSTAGAAKGGNTSEEVVDSPVSTAVGEPVATADGLLTDEEIFAIYHPLNAEAWDRGYDNADTCQFARAIEREIIGRLAAPTQAKPVDLSGLTRYEVDMEGYVSEWPSGGYVRFADVERLFAAPTQVSAPPEVTDYRALRKAVADFHYGETDAAAFFAALASLTNGGQVAQVSAPQADEASMAEIVQFVRDVANSGKEMNGSYWIPRAAVLLQIFDATKAASAQSEQASAAQEVRAVPGRVLDNLGGAIKMAVNMLSRDGTPARIEAAGALLAAFGEVAEQAVNSTSTAPAAMDEE